MNFLFELTKDSGKSGRSPSNFRILFKPHNKKGMTMTYIFTFELHVHNGLFQLESENINKPTKGERWYGVQTGPTLQMIQIISKTHISTPIRPHAEFFWKVIGCFVENEDNRVLFKIKCWVCSRFFVATISWLKHGRLFLRHIHNFIPFVSRGRQCF